MRVEDINVVRLEYIAQKLNSSTNTHMKEKPVFQIIEKSHIVVCLLFVQVLPQMINIVLIVYL